MDKEMLEAFRNILKEELEPMKEDIKRLERKIDDIQENVNYVKINIKETRDDARSSELATAQNSFEIAQIKMRMKMA